MDSRVAICFLVGCAACSGEKERGSELAEGIPDSAGDSRTGEVADVFGGLVDTILRVLPDGGDQSKSRSDSRFAEQASSDGRSSPVLVKLSPDKYTNEPIPVGTTGLGVQYDDLSGPVSVVKHDPACSVVLGTVGNVVVNLEYKTQDGSKALGGLSGVAVVTPAYEFELAVDEVYYGEGKGFDQLVVALGLCPRILVEADALMYEADYSENEGCDVPFLKDGVTYIAKLGKVNGCAPYDLVDGDTLVVFARYLPETGNSYVIVPAIVDGNSVESPCFPNSDGTFSAFESHLKSLLTQ